MSTVVDVRAPASRGSGWAVALAAMVALGPVIMVVLFVVFNGGLPDSSAIGWGVLGIGLVVAYEVSILPLAAVISFVLALTVRRRGGASRRNSTIALTILGVSVSLVVLQMLLYFPVWGSAP